VAHSPSPRAAAVAQLYDTAKALTLLGDHAAARLINATIASLLQEPGDGTNVVDISARRRT